MGSCLLLPRCHGVKVTRFVTRVVKTEKILCLICKIQDEIASLEKQKGPCSRTVQICKRHPTNLAGDACNENKSYHIGALPQLQSLHVWALGGDEPQLLNAGNYGRLSSAWAALWISRLALPKGRQTAPRLGLCVAADLESKVCLMLQLTNAGNSSQAKAGEGNKCQGMV